MTTYTLEPAFKIWNDETGERTEVGSDRDGLDLIEIRNVSNDGKSGPAITFTEDEAPLIIEALQRLLVFRNEKRATAK